MAPTVAPTRTRDARRGTLAAMPKGPIYYAPIDDPAMQAATERARATFKYLWRELTWEHRRIIPGLDVSAVKAMFADDGAPAEHAEHMWLGDVEFDGDTIGATLLNAPHRVRSVREGDRVELPVDRLEDWMYAMRGRVYGAFTVQVIRGRMKPAELRAHDEGWGLDFGSPETPALVPAWPPALVAAPDAEHPMSENMAPSLAAAIDKDPKAFLESADAKGLTVLHSLALGGSAAGVRVLLEKGADPWRRTRSGKTARDLAESMGWPRVVALLAAVERH